MKVPYNEMNFVWISNHYDVHWEGICRHEGKLCKFITHDLTDYQKMNDECPYCSDQTEDWNACTCGPYSDLVCDIIPLGLWEKIKWIWTWKFFEYCVGTHWTYTGDSRKSKVFTMKRPFMFKLYYWLKGHKFK